VNAYRFEIERLDKQIGDIKQMWFTQKRQGTLGVIKEEQEDNNGGMQEMDGVM
jgi:hypothetical protein